MRPTRSEADSETDHVRDHDSEETVPQVRRPVEGEVTRAEE